MYFYISCVVVNLQKGEENLKGGRSRMIVSTVWVNPPNFIVQRHYRGTSVDI